MWDDALKKFVSRTKQLAEDHPPIALSVARYNSRVASVLAYIAQVASPPQHLAHIELAAFNRVFHFPTSGLSIPTINYLRKHLNFNINRRCSKIGRASPVQ